MVMTITNMRSAILCAVVAIFVSAGPAGATPAPSCTGSSDETRLHIRVANVARASGNITITLYPDDPDLFLARTGKIARIRTPAKAPVTSACLPAPAPGAYAVAIYHDENGDHDFQRTWIGLPNEGYGFSNDAETAFGLPRFRDVRFEADPGDNHLTIRVRYPDD